MARLFGAAPILSMNPKLKLLETSILVGMLAGCNLLAWRLGWPLQLTPGALWEGEVWRWITFPWVHVSWYHLLLDGSAFLFLYTSLKCGFRERGQHLLFCSFFSGFHLSILPLRPP